MDSSTSIRILAGAALASILSACGGSASALETDLETDAVRQRSELTAVTKAYGESDEPPPSDDGESSGKDGDLITVTSGSVPVTNDPATDPLTHDAVAVPVPSALPPANDDGPEGSGAAIVPVEEVDISVEVVKLP
jgi:hypothetical protein